MSSARLRLGLLLTAAMVAATSSPAIGATRDEAYSAFRSEFDAGRYEAALPHARQLVELTASQGGPDDARLVAPVTNLATTFYRLGRHAEAETQYLEAVRLLEASATPTDSRLIRPLHGLGSVYLEMGRPEEAAFVLKRAVDLSRNRDGLFNPNQIEIVGRLIDSYVALNRIGDAEREHEHAYRVAVSAYGRNDHRMLEPIQRYAGWFERVGRYATARALHMRALDIASQARSIFGAVQALRGIARTYRLAYLYGPEPVVAGQATSNSEMLDLRPAAEGRLDARGERALRLALGTVKGATPEEAARRGEILVDLGDWHLSGGQLPEALQSYRAAWSELVRGGSTAILEQPERVLYRPPRQAVSRSLAAMQLDPESFEEREVEIRLTVDERGRTRDVRVDAAGIEPKTVRALEAAARRALYRPRFADGTPVETADVVMRERIALRVEESS